MPGINSKIEKYDVKVSVIRSDRKSVIGKVLPDGSIEVRAPLAMPAEKINEFLNVYEPKFMPIVEEYRNINAVLAEHPFGYGGEVLFLGEWIPVKKAEDNNGGYMARYIDGAIVLAPDLSEEKMRYWVEDKLSSLAMLLFEEKLRYYAALMGVSGWKWTVGNARKRHGSCDSSRKITLSWRIIMMSEAVIEYIIVHELAHLKHMNHAKDFYNEVAAVLPDWKKRREAHGEYSLMLRCGGWL